MNIANPLSDLLWYCERRDDDAERYSALLQRQFPEQRIVRLRDYWAARDALAQARQGGEFPWLVLSDTVGVVAEGAAPSIAEQLRADCPLSLFYLFSSQAFSGGFPIEEWKRLRLLAEAGQKSNEP